MSWKILSKVFFFHNGDLITIFSDEKIITNFQSTIKWKYWKFFIDFNLREWLQNYYTKFSQLNRKYYP